MKLTIELEEEDVKKMLFEHFAQSGFSVRNLDELCAKFLSAYPDGLRIQADPIDLPPVEAAPVPVYPSKQEPVDDEDDDAPLTIPSVPEYEKPPYEDDDANPVLTMSELFDTEPRATRQEARVTPSEDALSITKLVRQSNALKEAGKPSV